MLLYSLSFFTDRVMPSPIGYCVPIGHDVTDRVMTSPIGHDVTKRWNVPDWSGRHRKVKRPWLVMTSPIGFNFTNRLWILLGKVHIFPANQSSLHKNNDDSKKKYYPKVRNYYCVNRRLYVILTDQIASKQTKKPRQGWNLRMSENDNAVLQNKDHL